ncbi:MAG: class I SAM-dependent rRNA methyltransferase [Verrucomicrobiota bacterium]
MKSIDIFPPLLRISAVPTVQLKYQTFHPSIWPKMIGEVSRDATPGSFVLVLGKEGTPFGWGLWNPKSRMPLRIVSHSLEELEDESFFENAIRRAARLRREILKLDGETDSYRAIHGDADFMPGIVADKFGDVLSVEITNLAAWQRLPKWLPLLHESFDTKRVVVGVDADLARIEGIPRVGGVESDKVRSVKIREHGIRYEVDFSSGHKTGFFCDQRDNRRAFGALAAGKSVLDLCCYSGGFSVSAALAGAAEVTAVDLDENAVEMAKRNANLNGAKVKFTHADAFTWIRTMIENGRKWDLVIADPPKFIFGKEDEIGTAKYADLNKLALQLVAPEGLYVTCSCSGMLGAGEFERIVVAAAHRQDKRMQVFNRTGAGPDHPTLSNYPESRYLKVLWSRVI